MGFEVYGLHGVLLCDGCDRYIATPVGCFLTVTYKPNSYREFGRPEEVFFIIVGRVWLLAKSINTWRKISEFLVRQLQKHI